MYYDAEVDLRNRDAAVYESCIVFGQFTDDDFQVANEAFNIGEKIRKLREWIAKILHSFATWIKNFFSVQVYADVAVIVTNRFSKLLGAGAKLASYTIDWVDNPRFTSEMVNAQAEKLGLTAETINQEYGSAIELIKKRMAEMKGTKTTNVKKMSEYCKAVDELRKSIDAVGKACTLQGNDANDPIDACMATVRILNHLYLRFTQAMQKCVVVNGSKKLNDSELADKQKARYEKKMG